MFNFTAFLSYVLVVSFTPGPNVVLSMVNANKFGFRKTFKFLLGIFVGFFMSDEKIVQLSSNFIHASNTVSTSIPRVMLSTFP